MRAALHPSYGLELERGYLRAAAAAHRLRSGGGDRAGAEIAAQLARVEQAIADREPGKGDPMPRLAASLGLDPLEQDFLWTVVAFTADPRIPPHAHALSGSEGRRGLSLSLYTTIADLDREAAQGLALRLGPSHPLRGHRLLEADEAPDSPVAAPLQASRRLVEYLAGAYQPGALVHRADGLISPPPRVHLDQTQEAALEKVAGALGAGGPPIAIILEGPVGSGRRSAAAMAAQEHDRRLLAIDFTRVAPAPAALETAVTALWRDCLLSGALPLLAEVDVLTEGGHETGNARLRTLSRLIDHFAGTVVLTSSRRGLDLGLSRPLLRMPWPLPNVATRARLWRECLDRELAGSEDEINSIAVRYRLGAGGIERAARAARLVRGSQPAERALTSADLIAGVRNNISEQLGSLATRLEVKQTWDDLVLAQDLLDQIHALVARVRHAHRVYQEWAFHKKVAFGLGVPVLFSGPPGTGKTMIAGLIAAELGLELLQVDLSQVVSKWVGETEKQLAKIFDAAEAGHALLLFDEADSLFAKRTEVKGATDRYANLEVNYLLQRVESFGGIAILTTNQESSIDQALKRRLAAHVAFFPPDEDEREKLWRRLLDTGAAPLAPDLDLARLARAYPDMSGANIRNAALAAAFLAASDGYEITQDHLERAARGEYRTMGRVLAPER